MSDGSIDSDESGLASGDPEGPPTRICSHCSTVSQTSGDYCPQCGKSYVKKPRLTRRVRLVLAGLVLVLILGGAGAAVAIKNNQDEETKRKHAIAIADARAKQERAEEAHREAEDEAKVKRESEEGERRSDEKELEKGIEADAKKLLSEEVLTEPILGVSCTPVSGGSSVELKSPTGTYSCIAITKREASGEVSGYAFSGTIDFAKGSFTYHYGRN